MKLISRVFGFDAGHRVIDHKSLCKNFHGHRYHGEVTFSYKDEKEIGFTIDFGEIKRIALGYFDHAFDHGMILNPHDREMRSLCDREHHKTYIMSLNGSEEFCNPTAEMIIKEMLLGLKLLFNDVKGVEVWGIKLYETPNCSVENFVDTISLVEEMNFNYVNEGFVLKYKKALGI